MEWPFGKSPCLNDVLGLARQVKEGDEVYFDEHVFPLLPLCLREQLSASRGYRVAEVHDSPGNVSYTLEGVAAGEHGSLLRFCYSWFSRARSS